MEQRKEKWMIRMRKEEEKEWVKGMENEEEAGRLKENWIYIEREKSKNCMNRENDKSINKEG